MKHSHYYIDVSEYDTLDVYDICELYKIEDSSGATQHALKKILLAGKRGGGKDKKKDLKEAIDSLQCKVDRILSPVERAVDIAQEQAKLNAIDKSHGDYDSSHMYIGKPRRRLDNMVNTTGMCPGEVLWWTGEGPCSRNRGD